MAYCTLKLVLIGAALIVPTGIWTVYHRQGLLHYNAFKSQYFLEHVEGRGFLPVQVSGLYYHHYRWGKISVCLRYVLNVTTGNYPFIYLVREIATFFFFSRYIIYIHNLCIYIKL